MTVFVQLAKQLVVSGCAAWIFGVLASRSKNHEVEELCKPLVLLGAIITTVGACFYLGARLP
jgi:hypothetical protein